jgi:hypothetical protein
MADDFEAYGAGESWAKKSVHGQWQVVSLGQGTVGIAEGDTKLLVQSPAAPSNAFDINSALVATTLSYTDLDMQVKVRVRKQLGKLPDSSQTAWLLWRYADSTHHYFLALKSGRWVLGKTDASAADGVRELATWPQKLQLDQWYTIRVRQVGPTATVWVDGAQKAEATDNDKPYATGMVGLMSQQAEVQYDAFSLSCDTNCAVHAPKPADPPFTQLPEEPIVSRPAASDGCSAATGAAIPVGALLASAWILASRTRRRGA